MGKNSLNNLGKFIGAASLATGCTTNTPAIDKTIIITEKNIRVVTQPSPTPSITPNVEKPANHVEKIVTLGENGHVDSLTIKGVFGNVEITVGNEAKVIAAGISTLMDQVSFGEGKNPTISLPSNGYTSIGDMVYLSKPSENGSVMVGIVNGQISGDPYALQDIPTLKIQIPLGTKLHLENSLGDTTIDETGDVDASVSGSSSLVIRKMNGNLDLDVSGSSQVSIQEGNIPAADISTSGSSRVTILATINELKAKSSGGSRIKAIKVIRVAKEDSSGSSGIDTN